MRDDLSALHKTIASELKQNNIFEIMNKKGLSIAQVAQYLEITEDDLKNILIGIRSFNIKELLLFKELAQVKTDEIYPALKIEHFTDRPTITQSPLLNTTKTVEKTYYVGWQNMFKRGESFTLDLVAKQVLIAFTILVGVLVIATDNLFNTYVLHIVPLKLGMLKLYAICWAIAAILVGLTLPFIIRSPFSYLALFGGLSGALHLIDLKFIKTYITLPPQKWIDIIIAVIALLLSIGYGALMIKIRALQIRRALELDRVRSLPDNLKYPL